MSGLIIGFIYGWKLALVVLSVSPLLAASAAFWSTVSVWGFINIENQKNLTTLMHRKGGENGRNLVWFLSWEVCPTFTLISAPPAAFLWVPKHTLVSCAPSVCISCSHAMLQEGNLHQSIFLALQCPHGKRWGSPCFSLLAQIPFNLFPSAHACTTSLANNLPSFMLYRIDLYSYADTYSC